LVFRMTSSCSIGKLVATECGGERTHKSYNLTRKVPDEIPISSLSRDVSSWPFKNVSVESCPNVNEKWIIEQRIGHKLNLQDTICAKHRESFSHNWKHPRRCLHPGHEDKTKFDEKWRKMSLLDILQAKLLYSSSAKSIHIPLG